MNQTASSVVTDGIALITLDNPPVNALSAPLRQALQSELDRAFRDDQVHAIMLICAGRTFIAGADITEFGQPWQSPSLPDLCAMLDAAPKPVIAAIHGTALGGGFELALACHYRVVAASARVGLPEVNLGLLPGAGGTQRIPRVVGAKAALDIVTSGRQIKAKEALSLGLVDAIADDPSLQSEALAFARRVVADGAAKPRVQWIAQGALNAGEHETQHIAVALRQIAVAGGRRIQRWIIDGIARLLEALDHVIEGLAQCCAGGVVAVLLGHVLFLL